MSEGTDVLVQAPVEIEPKPVELPKEVKITAEEGLNLRNIEMNFLKEQMTSERTQRAMQDLNKSFVENVDSLAKKYDIDKDKYTFNAVALAFIRK